MRPKRRGRPSNRRYPERLREQVVPLVVWGSILLLKLIERYPVIIYIGAAAIAWTTARMITHDDLVDGWFDAHRPMRYLMDAVLVIGVTGIGWWLRGRRRRRQD